MSAPPTEPADETAEPGTNIADPGAQNTEPSADLSDIVPEPQTMASAGKELNPYDAVVLLSFGGPEAPDEVMPFLRRVTGGRGIPDERLEQVAEHYHHFGGKSPINDQNRDLLKALRAELDRRDLATPLLWGNRNSAPFLTDTLREAHDAGLRNVVVVTTSAYSCYSSCRQYREDLADAVATLADEGKALAIDKVRPYWNHPGFAATNVALVTHAVQEMHQQAPDEPLPRIICVTHSIPDAMDDTSGPGDEDGNLYREQHQRLSDAIGEEVSATMGQPVDADLAYCSRSGPPSQPWLEPDINDHLTALHAEGVERVVVAPIGFVSDHMEVVFDLDTEAAETVEELGLQMTRVPTVGVDTQFVTGLVDLVIERAALAREETVQQPAWPDPTPRPVVCRPGCCPNLRVSKPACCGQD
ncbi:MAG: ferrochelatase [Ornithinimicrobium sp.]